VLALLPVYFTQRHVSSICCIRTVPLVAASGEKPELPDLLQCMKSRHQLQGEFMKTQTTRGRARAPLSTF
jgi:hypothetical protein